MTKVFARQMRVYHYASAWPIFKIIFLDIFRIIYNYMLRIKPSTIRKVLDKNNLWQWRNGLFGSTGFCFD